MESAPKPRTSEWVQAGIISRAQAAAIERHEADDEVAHDAPQQPSGLVITVVIGVMAAAMATMMITTGAQARIWAIIWMGFAAGVIVFAYVRRLPSRLADPVMFAGAALFAVTPLLSSSTTLGAIAILLSVPIAGFTFWRVQTVVFRFAAGLMFILVIGSAIILVWPETWEPQVAALTVQCILLLGLAWVLPQGRCQTATWTIAALLGLAGLAGSAYAMTQTNTLAPIALGGAVLYLLVVALAWTGRLQPFRPAGPPRTT